VYVDTHRLLIGISKSGSYFEQGEFDSSSLPLGSEYADTVTVAGSTLYLPLVNRAAVRVGRINFSQANAINWVQVELKGILNYPNTNLNLILESFEVRIYISILYLRCQ
jgi:hypothetical protein